MGVNGHWYIELEKQGYWKGKQHTYVNRYVLSGAQPSQSDATTVINALQAIENRLFPNRAAGQGVGFVQGRAYPSGKGSYFAAVDYNLPLTPSGATGFQGPSSPYTSIEMGFPLESCLECVMPLTGMSSTGKPVTCRKYFRGICTTTEGGANDGLIASGDLGVIAATIAPWQSGMGASGWVVIGSSGRQASGAPSAQQYIGNHQVPRGRKKKAASASVLTTIGDATLRILESGTGSLLAELAESAL